MSGTDLPGAMPDSSDDELLGRLGPFLAANPEARFKRAEGQAIIGTPWGDTTVEIVVPEENDELVASLNAVFLPPRYTAIFHRDSGDLEVIWGPVPRVFEERSRAFEFRFEGKTYQCKYGEASSRLLRIAEFSRPSGPGPETSYRNLVVLRGYLRRQRRTPESELVTDFSPTSFWITCVPEDENELLRLVRHLNFYMQYFDLKTPHVLIHEEPPSKDTVPPPGRYPFDSFPGVVSARPLDPYLLGLWEGAARATDTFRRFLYRYQIIEYAAFYYLQESTFYSIRKLLASPNLPARLDDSVRQILDMAVEARMDDEAKIVAVIKQVVDPERLWKQIEPALAFFSSDVVFDGGFALPALLKPGWGLDDFKSAWIPKFPDALRKLRNALVHAREARMAKGISPTHANYERIRPWTALVSFAASQVIAFREI